MKVKLLRDWNDGVTGDVIELSDAKAKRLMVTGLVAKVKAAKKKSKPKEQTDERIQETSSI
jgi:hypothetical protein